VFADDASPQADVAWLWTNAHRWSGWSLEVVTASAPRWDEPADRADVHSWQPERLRPQFREPDFTRTRFLTAASDPRVLLLRPAGLTVVGDHGPGLLKRLHVGSTMSWLLRSPAGPLLIARHGRVTRCVLVCHDGGPHADAALDALVAMPWAAGLHVIVLVVKTPDVDPTRVLTAVLDGVQHAGMDGEPLVLSGDPIHAIERTARDLDPDLVVLGTAGRSGIDRLALGSTASSVTHGCAASVLIARAR
jgi:nucleotide-binding universal stress UspA family protein